MTNFLWVLFHPSYWFQINSCKYSEQLDKSLNQLLDEGTPFKILNGYYVQLGSYVLWFRNHPYASFETKIELLLTEEGTIDYKVRPSRRTRARLMAALLKQEPMLKELN